MNPVTHRPSPPGPPHARGGSLSLLEPAARSEQQRPTDGQANGRPRRPERSLLASGSSTAMMYHRLPSAPCRRPILRSLSPVTSAGAQARGIAMFALLDALLRMQAKERMPAIERVTEVAPIGNAR